MSEIDVRVDTAGGVEPGSEISGGASWSCTGKRCERVAIRLFWFTQGKGTEDLEVVDEKVVEPPAQSSSERFSFRLPGFPWSYSGKLLAITWAVEATLEPKGEADRIQFVCGPGGREVHI